MPRWESDAIILGKRPLGEHSVLADTLTLERGRHLGVVQGGAGRKLAPVLQPGSQVNVQWSARLEAHLGRFKVEPIRSRSVSAMTHKQSLLGLNATCAMLTALLPERAPYPALYEATYALMDLLPYIDVWPLAYLQWEVLLLSELGFSLSISRCAVSGDTHDLRYISPKTGCAIGESHAGEWVDRLLPLVPIMRGKGSAGLSEISKALSVTQYFFEHKLLAALSQKEGKHHTPSLPAPRARLIDHLDRCAP